MRLAKRYICVSVLLTSLLWFLVYLTTSSVDISETWDHVNIKKSAADKNEEFVKIDYFKRFYKNSLNLEPEGAGSNGQAVLNSVSENSTEEKSFDDYGFNELASSKISLERSISDNRDPSCFNVDYHTNLPTASIIIIFYNEAWSTLLRTVHSVLARSPPHMVEEIILVDDASNKEKYVHLGEKLKSYISNLVKVKLIRSHKRVGLTQARLIGANNAIGEVLVFLDSHCEANVGWLEPLLARLQANPKIAVVPDIEVISFKNFEYVSKKGSYSLGLFTWQLMFTWGPLPLREKLRRKLESDPIKSPTMAGGLFAMNRKFFFESGAYDPELTYWGGENVEISFRLWMCSEGIEIIPCSRVGHVFREKPPYKSPPGSTNHNSIRVAEVWLDEFKDIFYSLHPNLKPEYGGDISERKKLRESLKCKSFKWFLQNITPEVEVPDKFPYGRGDIKNLGTLNCLDTLGQNVKSGKPGLYNCHKMGSNQLFIYTKMFEILHDNLCLDLSESDTNAKVKLWPCHKQGGYQKWNHSKNGFIKSEVHNKCLEGLGTDILIRPCDPNNKNQLWVFENYPHEEKPPNVHENWF